MAIQINGNGTITGISVGGLPNGIVDTDMLANNAVTEAKSTITAGKVLQVQKTIITAASGENMTTSFQNLSGYAVTITPSSASNHIYLTGHINVESHQQYCTLRFVRQVGGVDSNPAGFRGDAGQSNQVRSCFGNLYRAGYHDSYNNVNEAFHLFDTDHNTTSAITYQLQFTNSGSSYPIYFNRSHTDSNTTYSYRCMSSIIAMEIAA